MKYMNRQKLANVAAEKWKNSYRYYDNFYRLADGRTSSEVHKQLIDLGPNPNYRRVNEVIGNESWTRYSCDSCGDYPDEWVEMPSHSDDEYGPCAYCESCLQLALQLLS